MTKDAIIAMLVADKADLAERLRRAEADLERLRGAARERQSRHRNVTGHVSRHVVGDVYPLERVDTSFLSGDVANVTPDPKLEGKTHTEPAAPKRDGHVTFDRERAADDAAKHGLLGADFEAELEHFEDYWTSAGWRRKNGPVKDRNATWREWLRSPYRRPNGNGNGLREPAGMAALREWNRKMDEQERCIEGEVIR